MAYYKAREEHKWLEWKKTEENILREQGFDEVSIQELRQKDWDDFKSERRFLERWKASDEFIEQQAHDEGNPSLVNVQDFIDEIEDEELLKQLLTVDKLTLQLAVLRTQGFSMREIADLMNLSDKSVYRRMDRLKEKLKKFL